ncbi:hypothetical protein G6O69_21205 [Pseudenhygromyxa sp. WMMC2535]|uniref:hypothetical protein n=1 Tax=Pseudenhygromyxa sp. WMMC2535 TaxID=2712867 RepID=UPI00155520A5|nr:hypothetical protein [Pseudenhygromyxa sp. WMMC2535]NVB40371.1 hypothetical protein [Pseudenhygromyxa sp. WMMC2535]
MRHTWLCTPVFALLLVGACKRDQSVSPADPGSESAGNKDEESEEQPDEGESLTLLPVPQMTPPHPDEWVFSPDSRRIAAEIETEALCGKELFCCAQWDLDSGALVDVSRVRPDEDTPCELWEVVDDDDLPPPVRGGSEGRLADAAGDEIWILDAAGETELGTLSLALGWLMGVDWAPDGRRLVALTTDPLAVEIWDADAGERLDRALLPVVGDVDDLRDMWVAWNDEGIVVALTGKTELLCSEIRGAAWACEVGYEQDEEGESTVDGGFISLYRWPEGGELISEPRVYTSASVVEFRRDPKLRWVFVVEESPDPRVNGGGSLVAVATGAASTQRSLGEWSPESDGAWEEQREGRWRSDVATTWLGTYVEIGADWKETCGWVAMTAEPRVEIFGGWRPDELDAAHVELLSAHAGLALAEYHGCIGEACHSQLLPLAGCERVEAGPRAELVLADCGQGLAVVEPGVLGRDGRPGQVLHNFAVDPNSEFRWLRSGALAILSPDGRLMVVDPRSGAIGYTRAGVANFAQVALGEAHGVLGLNTMQGELELVTPSTGEVALSLPEPDGLVGISPDGQTLAGVFGETLELWSLATKERSASFSIHPASDVAWRQDGAALFTGIQRPKYAIDPANGKVLYRLPDRYLEVGTEGLDPSWRWLMLGDQRIVRLVDLRMLDYGWNRETRQPWVRLDDGCYEGPVPRDAGTALRYRVLGEPGIVPMTEDEVSEALVRPGLAEAFFAGEALEELQISRADYERILAERESP